MGELRDQLLKSALDMAARGLRVFPLEPGSKEPVKGLSWKKLATTDERVIRKVWSNGHDYNVGVAMGHGFLGLDIDVKNGKTGLASAETLGVELAGLVVKTPSGGFHVYFRDAPDVANRVGRLGPGLDVRSAGGYLVGPGSVVAGEIYATVEAEAIRPVPPSVIQGCLARAERPSDVPAVELDTEDAIAHAIEFLETAPAAVERQGGDDATYRIAARLKDQGVSEEAAYELLLAHWNERCSPPWAPEDLKTKVANAYEYGSLPPGISHPQAEFAYVNLEEAAPTPPIAETGKGRSWFRHGDAHSSTRWLYYNMFPRLGSVVLSGPPQGAKTFLAIELARSLATGKPFFGEVPDERGGTLFLFAGSEGSGLAMRLDALQEAERLPIAATTVANLAAKDALTDLLADLKAESARMLEQFGVPVRMIVLETLAASGLLKDENDNAEASRAMTNLAQLGHVLGALVVTTHHPPKDGKGMRGASALLGSADYVVEITRQERSAIREVELTKARDAEQRKLGAFTLLPVDLGQDERGRPIVSMTISMGPPAGRASRAPNHTDAFLEALDWLTAEEPTSLPEGRKGVLKGDLLYLFKDRKDGTKDRSNVNREFKQILTWAESTGTVQCVPWNNQVYILKREIEEP